MWGVASVKDALTSPRTQGIKLSKDQPVLDSDGEYVRLGDPTFDDETWTQIQKAVKEREASGKRRTKSTNPVLHVGYCECGASLTKRASNGHTYYRCGRTPVACKGVSIKQGAAHVMLERVMTVTFGEMRATRRVFVPGSDNSAELETVHATIRRLRAESDAGLITTAEDEADWLERLKAQTAKRDALAATPVRHAKWEIVEEEETYGEKYSAADDIGRRDILRDAGIRLTLHRDGEPTLTPPAQIADLLGDSVPVSYLESIEWRTFLAAAIQTGMSGEDMFTEDGRTVTFIGDNSVLTVPRSFVEAEG